jgi:hypothetical protein
VPEEREVKKLAFRFTATCGCPIPYPRWQDIAHFPGVTVNENDVIEFAYAAPVVSEEMTLRACNAYDSNRDGEDMAEYPAMHRALTAALEPDNAN